MTVGGSTDAQLSRAPAAVARRLRALRCGCGGPAAGIHFVSAAGIDDSPWPVGGQPAASRNTYPSRERGAVLRACCSAHDLGGYWIALDRLIARWSGWMEHLARKPWRGDLLLREFECPGTGWRR